MSMEIPKAAELEQEVFSITNEKMFPGIALEVFAFQYAHNPLYRSFCDAVRRPPSHVSRVEDIPFLPISFFKSHSVMTGSFDPALHFRSSGTTGASASRHLLKDPHLYEKSFLLCFERFYGSPEEYCILGLLPSYLERGDSSLVYMVSRLLERSGHPLGGFYLHDHDRLAQTLRQLEAEGRKTLLIGVTYALLDFAQAHPMPLKSAIVMETGGMKGRGRELVRSEVHGILSRAFHLPSIHSEYGMTELLSQAYSPGGGLFRSPPWMKILVRDETDPLSQGGPAEGFTSGALNIIDLANLYSCSFIATEDSARLHPDGSFEVLGRLDNSDVRGCSLMAV
ncbi:MAG TPA: acyl transferase [Flavisolibacter sp.]|jgi:non-ribosomal peptide synthetase component F